MKESEKYIPTCAKIYLPGFVAKEPTVSVHESENAKIFLFNYNGGLRSSCARGQKKGTAENGNVFCGGYSKS